MGAKLVVVQTSDAAAASNSLQIIIAPAINKVNK